MVDLSFLFQLQPDKRQEFFQFIESLPPASKQHEHRHLLFQAVDDENLFCLLIQFVRRQELEAFKNTNHYRALLGALKALGSLQKLELIEPRSVP